MPKYCISKLDYAKIRRKKIEQRTTKDKNNNIIHIVCGMNGNLAFIITAYYPDSDEWEEDMKTRRKE